jgi:propionyl-CoA carboxylase alpha chain/3-methylcrotonyl-CoA carboxylase alpha subunit
MPDRVRVIVDALAFAVDVRANDLVVDGAPHVVTDLGDGRYRIDGPSGAVEAVAAVAGDRTWIAIGDETFECRTTGRGRGSLAASSSDTVSSPMPATVTAIPAAVGQRVEAGDVLIALEAMKMELPLRAPGRAVVAAVHCRVGDLVQPDVTLIELRPAPGAPDL